MTVLRLSAKIKRDHVFQVMCVTLCHLPVSDEVVSGGQKVILDVEVGQVVDDLRRGVGLMRRVVARLRACLKGNVSLVYLYLFNINLTSSDQINI